MDKSRGGEKNTSTFPARPAAHPPGLTGSIWSRNEGKPLFNKHSGQSGARMASAGWAGEKTLAILGAGWAILASSWGKKNTSLFSGLVFFLPREKKHAHINKTSFLAESRNVENIYPCSAQGVFMAQKPTIPGLWGPSCMEKQGGG